MLRGILKLTVSVQVVATFKVPQAVTSDEGFCCHKLLTIIIRYALILVSTFDPRGILKHTVSVQVVM